MRRAGTPLWQRLYLDLIALAVAGLVYWLTARTGFSAVVNPDSNPTLSLSVYMFLAPALLWIGAALLLVRLRGRALAWLAARGRAAAARRRRAASCSRAPAGAAPAINRGLLVLGLLLAFGVNLGIFTATYDQQARVDAQLTLGADVVATAPPGVVAQHRLAGASRGVPGVAGVDRGRPRLRLRRARPAGHLRHRPGDAHARDDACATPTSSAAARRRCSTACARRRTGSSSRKETITDYSLRPRRPAAAARARPRAAAASASRRSTSSAIVQEFPSAPKDSFMVANLAYLRAGRRTTPGRTSSSSARRRPARASPDSVAAATAGSASSVKDIRAQTAQTVSSITTVDLRGISRIEEAFVLVLAAAAMALFVAVGLAERRHEFATMAALGASLRRVGGVPLERGRDRARRPRSRSRRCSAGCSRRCSSRCSSTCSTRRPTTSPSPGPSSAGSAPPPSAGCARSRRAGGAAIRRLPLGAILREE